MFRRRSNYANRRGQAAFSLVPALFLLIVLAGLGAVAVRLVAVQQQTTVLAIQSTRAYAAARAGVEAAIYEALINNNCTTSSIALSEAGLAGFTVDVSCNSTTHTEGATATTVFVIDAFAYAGLYGSPDYVSRRIRTKVTDVS